MRTTIDIPDELFRHAKSEAALRGRKLKDLIEQGLRMVLATPPAGGAPPPSAPPKKKAHRTRRSERPDIRGCRLPFGPRQQSEIP